MLVEVRNELLEPVTKHDVDDDVASLTRTRGSTGSEPATIKHAGTCQRQGGYIFYAGASLAGVSCRRRWPRLLLLS